MTTIDVRLLPLIDALASAGADWLAFELIDTLRWGIEVEESEEVLKSTRDKVRNGLNVERISAPLSSEQKSLRGDDQIAWAAAFIADRLEGALSDLFSAHEALQVIGDTQPPSLDFNDGQAKSRVGDQNPVAIMLDDPVAEEMTLNDLQAAMNEIQNLRVALNQWRDASIIDGSPR